MKTKTIKILEWVCFSILFLIFLLAVGLLFYQKAYADKIYRNVTVAGVNISGQTPRQARYEIQKIYESILTQEVTLRADDKEVKTTLADTGLDLDIDKIVDDAYAVGRSNNFIAQLFASAKTVAIQTQVQVKPKIDDAKYQAFLDIAVAQLNINPINAQITIENGQVKEIAETDGKVVKTDNLLAQILSMAHASDKMVVLETITAPSTVRAADFGTCKQFANNILGKNIRFTYAERSYTPNRIDLGNWVSFGVNDGKCNAALNDSNVKAYLATIAKNFEVIRKDRKINSLDNSVLEEGNQGLYLNKDDALAKIKAQIFTSNSFGVALVTYTEDPKELRVIPAEGLIPGRFEGRYLDVDLTTQRLCRIESTSIIDCFSISSGKPGMPTPTGTFTIRNKNPRQFSHKYGLWMPWWQEFNGDYGIHELPETNTWKEVPDHLGTPVSHGCIRLGVGPAQTVYEWTSIGTPVYIHK